MPEQPKVIRKRIRSVTSTKKITRTMEMVATAKLRSAQQRVTSSGPYLEQLRGLMREIGASGIDVSRWPQFETRDSKRTLLMVMTSNRGLCGAFNANIFRLARQVYQAKKKEGHEILLYVAGRKGITAMRYQGFPIEKSFVDEIHDKPTPKDAEFFLEELSGPFLRGEVDEVIVVYPHWLTLAHQPPTALRLLPIAPDEHEEEEQPASGRIEPLFEPSAEEILDRLLPLYLRQTVYSILAEAVASEQLARRMAMKLATDNADELVIALTRQYNQARQAQITKELSEIIGGAEALK